MTDIFIDTLKFLERNEIEKRVSALADLLLKGIVAR